MHLYAIENSSYFLLLRCPALPTFVVLLLGHLPRGRELTLASERSILILSVGDMEL